MVSSMKLRITISIAIGLAVLLTSIISAEPITQNSYAAASPSNSSASGGSLGGARV
jgi:hypothetical protein